VAATVTGAALVPILAIAALAIGRATDGGGVLATLGAHGALAVAPGLLAWGLFLRRERPAVGVFAALALGPVIGLAAILPGFLWAVRSSSIVFPAAIALAVAAAAVALRIAPTERADEEGGARRILPVLAVLLVAAALLPLVNPWWRVRSDAWFHAAFAIEARDFGVPPIDPFYSGMPLRYFWMFHAFLGALCALSAGSPFPFFALINLQALAAFALGLHLISARFRKDVASNRAAVLMGTLGLNALFWLFVPLKALIAACVGKDRGPAEFARTFDVFPFDLNRWILFLSPLDGAQPFLLSKFFVGGSYSTTLALALLYLLFALRALDRPRAPEAALAGFALCGLWAFHPDVGLFLVPAVWGGAAVLVALAPWADRRRIARALLPAAIASVAATLLFSPYLLGIGGGGAGGIRPIDVSPRRAVALMASGVAILALAPFRFRELWRRAGLEGRLFLLVGIWLAALALIVRLPGSLIAQTMDKNPYFFVIGLAVPAGWALADLTRGVSPPLRRRALLAWTVGGLLLPANIAAYCGYWLTPDRFAVQPEERELNAWVARETPREAIFLESRNVDRVTRMHLPVLAARRVYAGADTLAHEWNYPIEEIEGRARLEKRLEAGEAVADVAALADPSGRSPVYFLRFLASDGAGSEPRADPLGDDFAVVFENSRFRVLALSPPRPRPIP